MGLRHVTFERELVRPSVLFDFPIPSSTGPNRILITAFLRLASSTASAPGFPGFGFAPAAGDPSASVLPPGCTGAGGFAMFVLIVAMSVSNTGPAAVTMMLSHAPGSLIVVVVRLFQSLQPQALLLRRVFLATNGVDRLGPRGRLRLQ